MENCKSIWKPELYRIQMEAPKPKRIVCEVSVQRPEFYGKEYHGVLGHKEAGALLHGEPDGAFLVRQGSSTNDFYTLTWRFNGSIHHYKLYYDGAHYTKEKRYESVWTLVADGLLMSHMELRARHILDAIQSAAAAAPAYTDSPYVTLNRRKLKSLSHASTQLKQSELLEKLTISDSLESDTMRSTDLLINTNSADENLSTEDNLLTNYNKPHNFKVHTFKGLNWCELCANFLWGFSAQGVKCEDCGFIAHSKCSERVPPHCVPDLKRLRGVFGIDLTTLLSARGATLPFVVRMCVAEIEARGLDSEGIYRISGFADEIDALKMAFDKDGEAADLSLYSNINVVAGTLKLYLRLLPLPLITYDVHPHFLNTASAQSSEEQTRFLRECLARLPPAHYNTLQYMIQHLHRVSLLADSNKMSAHNLSTVFAPTLVATPPAVTDLTFEIRALQALIELSPHIYGEN